MTETYNYWLSLIHSGSLEELEIEIKEEIFKMTPYMDYSTTDITEEEAIDIAQGYNYE
jgi:hypothetical protein